MEKLKIESKNVADYVQDIAEELAEFSERFDQTLAQITVEKDKREIGTKFYIELENLEKRVSALQFQVAHSCLITQNQAGSLWDIYSLLKL